MNAVLDTLRVSLPVAAYTGLMSSRVVLAALSSPERAGALVREYAEGALALAQVRPEVRGLEHLPEGPCVLVANHQSHFDGPLVVAALPREVRFVAKAELFRIPVFGQALRATHNVEVQRQGGKDDHERVARAVRTIRSGTSVLFFAEGTRSGDGALRPFKKGAAVLALAAQVPLVPLALGGTRHVLAKGTTAVRRGRRVALVVGPPIPTAGLAQDARASLTAQCHARVAALLEEAEALTQETR
jgi:1-acyl-sn-glycerol-3-phosphate acyltransferase